MSRKINFLEILGAWLAGEVVGAYACESVRVFESVRECMCETLLFSPPPLDSPGTHGGSHIRPRPFPTSPFETGDNGYIDGTHFKAL